MKRNKFSLSNYHMTTLDQGFLVPIGHYEVLPGDTVQGSSTALLRAAPLLAPVMHPVHARVHHFYVPTRLIWPEFEQFITGGPTGTDATVRPYININGTISITDALLHYLGVPVGTYTNLQISALPIRAYQMIWREYFRDQDLQAAPVISTASGQDTTTSGTIQRVAWKKDYLTTTRPWQQKGNAVSVPLIGVATGQTGTWRNSSTAVPAPGAITGAAVTGQVQAGGIAAYYEPGGTLRMDISDLRTASAIQRYQEARARWGSRYTEYLRYLGVKSSDARLQRPEYLAGGKQTIQFSEVLQTAEGTNPVGMMRGHGIGAMRSNRYRRFIEEHGLIMSFLSVTPIPVYMQQMHRGWFRTTKEDYWQKELEHLSQQPVALREVYAPTASPASTFGFQDRYDEYRHHPSRVSGEFATTLKHWHMARDFVSAPTLNASFVAADPTNRIYAATASAQLYAMVQHSIQARRMITKTGTSRLS